MTQEGSDSKAEKDQQSVSLSRDELEMVELLRSMKESLARQAVTEAVPAPPEEVLPYDQAIVITHSAHEDRLQFGFVRLASSGKDQSEVFPIIPDIDYVDIDHIWDDYIIESGGSMENNKNDARLLRYISEQFQSARESHVRAREIIARYDETSKQADEVSRRTRELLSQKRT